MESGAFEDFSQSNILNFLTTSTLAQCVVTVAFNWLSRPLSSMVLAVSLVFIVSLVRSGVVQIDVSKFLCHCIAAAWFRYKNLLSSPYDEMTASDGKTNDGLGLGWNYWIAFLKPFQEHTFEQISVPGNVFKLVLVPKSCKAPPLSNTERIERVGEEIAKPIYFCHTRREIPMPVYKVKDRSGERIFYVALNFPMILQSTWGPSRNEKDHLRQVSVKNFLKKIRSLLNTDPVNTVGIMEYDDADPNHDLADLIVEKLSQAVQPRATLQIFS